MMQQMARQSDAANVHECSAFSKKQNGRRSPKTKGNKKKLKSTHAQHRVTPEFAADTFSAICCIFKE
jgi:hypothetical protein